MLCRVTEFQAFLIVAAGLVAILCAFVWLARRVRRSGVGGGILGPLDEIYRPAAHHVRQEMQAHGERVVPLSSADDLPRRGGTSVAAVAPEHLSPRQTVRDADEPRETATVNALPIVTS